LALSLDTDHRGACGMSRFRLRRGLMAAALIV
jgi:hypothetical protein